MTTRQGMPQAAIDNLTNHQEQYDMDGVMVKVSRQALCELLEYLAARQAAAPQGRGTLDTADRCSRVDTALAAQLGKSINLNSQLRSRLEYMENKYGKIDWDATIPAVAPDGAVEADCLVSVIAALKPAEEADFDFMLKLLRSAHTDVERRADLKLFRDQIINAAAGEMFALLARQA